jgi:hypothetical protein
MEFETNITRTALGPSLLRTIERDWLVFDDAISDEELVQLHALVDAVLSLRFYARVIAKSELFLWLSLVAQWQRVVSYSRETTW